MGLLRRRDADPSPEQSYTLSHGSHHRIGVEVVRTGIITLLTLNYEVTIYVLRLHLNCKILTRAAIILRSLQPVGNLVFVVSFLHHLASDWHLPCDTPPHLAPVPELLQAARSICCCSNCGYQNSKALRADLDYMRCSSVVCLRYVKQNSCDEGL